MVMKHIWRQLNQGVRPGEVRPTRTKRDRGESAPEPNLFSAPSAHTAPESCVILVFMHEFDAPSAKIAPI
jgi:hypothetical protein